VRRTGRRGPERVGEVMLMGLTYGDYMGLSSRNESWTLMTFPWSHDCAKVQKLWEISSWCNSKIRLYVVAVQLYKNNGIMTKHTQLPQHQSHCSTKRNMAKTESKIVIVNITPAFTHGYPHNCGWYTVCCGGQNQTIPYPCTHF